MSTLEFLSTRAAPMGTFQPHARSPLARLLGSGFVDLSLTLAKFEVRGGLDALAGEDLIRVTPARGLVLAPFEDGEAVEARLRQQVATVIEVTGALAGVRIERPDAASLMRRLTDLDLENLPAAGAVARVPAIVRGGGDVFELFWPQEYGQYLADVIVDTAEGLR